MNELELTEKQRIFVDTTSSPIIASETMYRGDNGPKIKIRDQNDSMPSIKEFRASNEKKEEVTKFDKRNLEI